MSRSVKSLLPAALRKQLYPLYHFLKSCRHHDVLRGRNWNLDIDVPDEMKNKFFNSIMMGTIDIDIPHHRTNVLLCAQPKSASLYIVELLSLCLALENHQIGFNKAGGTLYYPRLLAGKFTDKNTISHCHAEASPNVLKMIETLDLRPLVLTRNLLDALVSRRDMLLRDLWAENILSNQAVKKFANGTSEYQIDVIIDLFASQYMNFHAGWYQHQNDRNIRPIYITYEELIDDEIGMVEKVAAELNADVSRETIREISSKISKAGGINFSKGVTGRGKEMFSQSQVASLKQKAQHIGCYDEAFLGFKI